MKFIHDIIIDDLYSKNSNNFKYRKAVRGIILNDKDEVALIHIVGSDAFGVRDHYELPGGGIEDNEEYITALKREIKEEIGYEINNEKEIGIIEIEYNILNRIDAQYYFLANQTNYVGTDLIEYEKKLFKEIIYVPITLIEEFYENHKTSGVGKNIHKRDLIALKYAINNFLSKNT